MDQKIFDHLDRLERGARVETRPPRQYNNSSADYSAYDGSYADHAQDYAGYQGYDRQPDPFTKQPMTLDSFDEQLLRQPDLDSRQEQALRGQARMTLHPTARDRPPALPQFGGRSSQLNLSQFAYDGAPNGTSSLSPFDQPLPSSPTFHASQPRPAPLDLGRSERPSLQRGQSSILEQSARYLPVTAEEIDAEVEQYGDENADPLVPPPMRAHSRPEPSSKAMPANIEPPIVQGISLVPTHILPDRFRALFPYPLFNAVQSKCFNTIYRTTDNFVLSAPTGSGKTVALELAICRLINGFAVGSYKIVYQAPTKSLCSERQRDWQAKFGPLDLQCVELTGDTENVSQKTVQNATVIITTPEKWDAMTRKWKDQQKLMRMIKLFLIDEVHILKEDRGATLEAIVSRMKSIDSDVRFVALSATVPNSEDIATWLGKDPMNPAMPAPRERFGEEFRPVRLQKHVAGYKGDMNDFAFDKTLNGKLPEIINKYSQRKPIMVFCFTRPACVETATALSNWWSTKGPADRHWSQPRKRIVVGDKDLTETISSGVAFHHAGLTIQDRTAVEKGYLEGEIKVICCTSTLAVGVNLPCHMVIIKNTVSYQSTGCKEYSDLEIMQMLGRAGRPQFDDSAVAVIMTRLQRVSHYEKMITGQEVLESCLHRNLIDHLNAEIGSGTISNASSAKKWLSSTFLYVRLKENPEHYQLEGDPTSRNLEERLENICTKGLRLLENHDLISKVPSLHCTEFGDAMARYYIQFDTMKILLAIPQRAKVSEILSAISQAAEFKDVRFRAGEKKTYRELNKNTSIKFPLPGILDTPAHKISLVIQSVLAAIDFPSDEYKQRTEYSAAKATIFNNVNRLIRCIIDCQLYLEDAVAARNALALARSLGAQVWDDSPLHIKQLEGIGLVYVRKLVGAGIKSIDDLENADARRIETALSRNPPFGTQMLDKAKAFPKLKVSIRTVGEPAVKKGEHVTVNLKAELGFINEKVPITFQRKPVYVCLLAETSDGRLIHFARIGAKKLDKGQDLLFSANLTSASQSIRTYVMCDEIAGTIRHASLTPKIPPVTFPPPKTAENMNLQKALISHAANTAKHRSSSNAVGPIKDDNTDEFGDAGLDDADFAQAEADAFVDIDDFEGTGHRKGQPPKKKQKTTASTEATAGWEPTQLPSGKWACSHACKDKTKCKHLCCREGIDKKPKPKQPKDTQANKASKPQADPKQTQLGVSVTKKTSASASTTVAKSVEQPAPTKVRKQTDAREVQDLDKLHNSVKTKTPKVPILGQGKASGPDKKPLSFLTADHTIDQDGNSTDYGADSWDTPDLPNIDTFVGTQRASITSPPRHRPGFDNTDEEMLDAGDDFDGGDQLGQGNGDGYIDLSSYTNEGKDPHDAQGKNQDDEEYLFGCTPPATKEHQTKLTAASKNSNLFVGYSTDSAANDLGISQSRGKTSSFEQASATAPEAMVEQVRTRTPSAHQHEEAESGRTALPADDDFLAELDLMTAAPAVEEKASSPDSLKKWVMEEFGTEMFNFTW